MMNAHSTITRICKPDIGRSSINLSTSTFCDCVNTPGPLLWSGLYTFRSFSTELRSLVRRTRKAADPVAAGIRRKFEYPLRARCDPLTSEHGRNRKESLAAHARVLVVVDEFEHPVPKFEHGNVGRRADIQRPAAGEN